MKLFTLLSRVSLAACAAVLLVAASVRAEEPAPAPAGVTAAPAEAAAPAAEPTMQEKMEDMLKKLVAKASKVTNYTVNFTKQELVKGKWGELETVLMKHQKTPHCVYMKWLKDPYKDRETIFCKGWNKDEIKAHEGGFLKYVVVSLDPLGSMAMKGNRHSVLEAGIHHTVELITKDFEHGKKVGGVNFEKYGEQKVRGQDSLCVKVNQTKDPKAGFYAGAAEICVSKALFLPTSVKIWDFNGTLIEHYTYADYKVNPGLTQKDFDPENPEYAY